MSNHQFHPYHDSIFSPSQQQRQNQPQPQSQQNPPSSSLSSLRHLHLPNPVVNYDFFESRSRQRPFSDPVSYHSSHRQDLDEDEMREDGEEEELVNNLKMRFSSPNLNQEFDQYRIQSRVEGLVDLDLEMNIGGRGSEFLPSSQFSNHSSGTMDLDKSRRWKERRDREKDGNGKGRDFEELDSLRLLTSGFSHEGLPSSQDSRKGCATKMGDYQIPSKSEVPSKASSGGRSQVNQAFTFQKSLPLPESSSIQVLEKGEGKEKNRSSPFKVVLRRKRKLEVETEPKRFATVNTDVVDEASNVLLQSTKGSTSFKAIRDLKEIDNLRENEVKKVKPNEKSPASTSRASSNGSTSVPIPTKEVSSLAVLSSDPPKTNRGSNLSSSSPTIKKATAKGKGKKAGAIKEQTDEEWEKGVREAMERGKAIESFMKQAIFGGGEEKKQVMEDNEKVQYGPRIKRLKASINGHHPLCGCEICLVDGES